MRTGVQRSQSGRIPRQWTSAGTSFLRETHAGGPCQRPDQPRPGQAGWPPVRSIDGHLARPRPPGQSRRTEPAAASGYPDDAGVFGVLDDEQGQVAVASHTGGPVRECRAALPRAVEECSEVGVDQDERWFDPAEVVSFSAVEDRRECREEDDRQAGGALESLRHDCWGEQVKRPWPGERFTVRPVHGEKPEKRQSLDTVST